MKPLALLIFFLCTLAGLYKALEIETTLHDLLFYTNGLIIKEIVKMLFINPISNLNILLRLAVCYTLDFTKFMPDDPSILRPLIESLKRKSLPSKIQQRFYNFDLQYFPDGRKLLIEGNVNFARAEWDPFLFSLQQVKQIIANIKNSPQSQIEYLDNSALAKIIYSDDSNFFAISEHLNLFGICSFLEFNTSGLILYAWLQKVKKHLAYDDLLFYRLVFLSGYYLSSQSSFVKLAMELLKSVSTSQFRKSVLNYYFHKIHRVEEHGILLEIPDSILSEDPIAQATLHFENIFTAFLMGCDVPLDKVIELFQRFTPSSVSPFLCRKLLEWLNYDDLILILQEASSEWKGLYLDAHRGVSYFPRGLLPQSNRFRVWRSDIFCNSYSKIIGDIEDWPVISSHSRPWQWYIGDEYNRLKNEIIVERGGFTFIDCSASKESITILINGKVVEFLFSKISLPKFIPVLQEYGFSVNQSQHEHKMKIKLPESLCMRESTSVEASKTLNTILNRFKYWRVPDLLFASTPSDEF